LSREPQSPKAELDALGEVDAVIAALERAL